VARRDRSTGRNTIGDLSDPALISTLTDWLEGSGASALEITTPDGAALKIVLDPGVRAVPVAEAAPEKPHGRAVKAPMAGLFHDRHPGAGAGPLAGKGQMLDAGALAGFVAVGPVLLPVIAPAAGMVAEVHAGAGDLIGYGDAVLTMGPAR